MLSNSSAIVANSISRADMGPLLDRQLAKILVDDVAEMLEIDCERYDLHGAGAFGLIRHPRVNLADVAFDRLGQAVDDVVHPRHTGCELAIVGHDEGHDLKTAA